MADVTTEVRYSLGKGRVGVLRWNEARERDGFEWAVWEPHPFHGLTRTQVGRSDNVGAPWALIRASGTLQGSLRVLSVSRS